MKNFIEFIDKILKSEYNDKVKALEAEGFRYADEVVNKIEEMEDIVASALQDEAKFFNSVYEIPDSVDAWDDIVSESVLTDDMIVATLTPQFKIFFEEFITEFADKMVKSLDPEMAYFQMSQASMAFIDEWSVKLAELLKVSSHDNLKKILTKTIAEGESIPETMDALQDKFGFSRTRARRVANTEVLTVYSQAEQESYIQSPVVIGKEWLHSGYRFIDPREHHVSLSGTIVKKTDYFMIVAPDGIYYAMYPRDTNLPASERVYCHCTMTSVTDPSITNLTIGEKQELQRQGIIQADLKFATSGR